MATAWSGDDTMVADRVMSNGCNAMSRTARAPYDPTPSPTTTMLSYDRPG